MRRCAPSFARTPEGAPNISWRCRQAVRTIWKRSCPSQMESAQQGTPPWMCCRRQEIPARHRHGHLFDSFLTLYLEGRMTRPMKTARPAQAGRGHKVEDQSGAAFHRTAAASSSQPGRSWKNWASAALHLCLHLSTLRDRAYVRMDRQRYSRRQGPPGHHLPEQLLPPLCGL
jgi:hypothetical protein